MSDVAALHQTGRRAILRLLHEAIGAETHFIVQHPSLLFQCLWNSGWWFDHPRAEAHYIPPESGWPSGGPPWSQPEPKLSTLLESWRRQLESRAPRFWLRSLRPPPTPLGSPMQACLKGHREGVVTVAFSRDGDRIISRSFDGEVRAWETPTGRPCPRDEADAALVAAEARSGDGVRRARVATKTTIRIEECATGDAILVSHSHQSETDALTFSPDGLRLGAGFRDGTVWIWDATSGALLLRLETEGQVSCVEFAPDSRAVAVGSTDGKVRIWGVDSGVLTSVLTSNLESHRLWATCLAFSVEGLQLASGGNDRMVRVWELTGGALRAQFSGHSDRVTGLAWSPDSRRLASSSDDMTVRVWDPEVVAVIPQLVGHHAQIHSVAFTSDGERLVTESLDYCTVVWDASTGEVVEAVQRNEWGGVLEKWRREDPSSATPGDGPTPNGAPGNWRARKVGLEIVVEAVSSGLPVAWFPARAGLGIASQPEIATHPSRRLWALAIDSHLYLFTLEGGSE